MGVTHRIRALGLAELTLEIGIDFKGSPDLRTGGDSKFREYPVQVRTNRSVGKKELLPDFLVGAPFRRQLRDLKFLWSECILCRLCSWLAGLASRSKLASGPLGPHGNAEGFKRVTGGPQWTSRVGDAKVSTQPGSVRELSICSYERPTIQIRCQKISKVWSAFFLTRKKRQRVSAPQLWQCRLA
jgi:hypothetical protein